jgi:hypothetical protein
MLERRQAERRVETRGYCDERRRLRGLSYEGLEQRLGQRRIRDRRTLGERRVAASGISS